MSRPNLRHLIDRYCGAAGVILLALVHGFTNYLWLRSNKLPPHDDLAYHLIGGLNIADYAGGIAGMFVHGLSQSVIEFYPPLFHVVMASFIRVFGRSETTAVMANAPFSLLFLAALYMTGKAAGDRRTGLLAGLIGLSYPLIFDAARISLPDYAMTAMVAAAFCVLIYTGDFSRRLISVLFGITLGLGMLTKQVFLFFLAGPFVASLVYGLVMRPRQRGQTVANAALAAAAGLAVCGYWYFPRIDALIKSYVHVGYTWETSMPVFTLRSLTFYGRALCTHLMLLPLLTVFIAGVFLLLWRGENRRFKLLLFSGLIGSYVVCTLVATKEAKTVMPLSVYCALISSAGIMSIRPARFKYLVAALVAVFGALQYAVIGFAVPRQLADCPTWRYCVALSGHPIPVFRMGGRFQPFRQEFPVRPLLDALKKHREAEIGVFTTSMNSEDRQQFMSNCMANYYAVEYFFTREKMPYRLIMMTATAPQEVLKRISLAVVSDNMRLEFMDCVPGEKKCIAEWTMPDSSVLFLFSVRQADL